MCFEHKLAEREQAMWTESDDRDADLSPEMLQAKIEILTDIIGVREGKSWEEMHPELTPEERCERAALAAQFAGLMHK